jgi:hypothetical protein
MFEPTINSMQQQQTLIVFSKQQAIRGDCMQLAVPFHLFQHVPRVVLMTELTDAADKVPLSNLVLCDQ